MKITIVSKANIKDPFRERAEKKLQKLDRFFDSGAEAVVKVSFNKDMETVEVTIRSQGLIFRAERTTEDKFASLEAVVDILTKQIVRNKTKLEKKMKTAPDFEVLEFTDDFTEEPQTIVKTKHYTVRPMGEEEAILQMDMLGHQFFLFRSTDGGDIHVLYRRRDGQYGLIIPE